VKEGPNHIFKLFTTNIRAVECGNDVLSKLLSTFLALFEVVEGSNLLIRVLHLHHKSFVNIDDDVHEVRDMRHKNLLGDSFSQLRVHYVP